MEMNLFYATNRKHKGKNRWKPTGYGTSFSDDGRENLRFGKLTLPAANDKIQSYLNKDQGNGEEMAGYLADKAKEADITAYREKIDPNLAEHHQPRAVYGSQAMFSELKLQMEQNNDVLIFIHGFNVSWEDAVGSALALQTLLNHKKNVSSGDKGVLVVLFTWPSDGMMLPLVSYKSDRSDAAGSGYAIGRGILKLRDFLKSLTSDELCGQNMHLLCHSMGNYVLQHALKRIIEFNAERALPRIFEHIFLCSSDVDDDVLEPGKPMARLHEICRDVTIYHNRDDVALRVADYTKGNPDRLGTAGAARPGLLHNKITQVDCTEKVKGLIEHSYYLWGYVDEDIRMTIDAVLFDDSKRHRKQNPAYDNLWTLV